VFIPFAGNSKLGEKGGEDKNPGLRIANKRGGIKRKIRSLQGIINLENINS